MAGQFRGCLRGFSGGGVTAPEPTVTQMDLMVSRGQSLALGPNIGAQFAPSGERWRDVLSSNSRVRMLSGLRRPDGVEIINVTNPLLQGYDTAYPATGDAPARVQTIAPTGQVAAYELIKTVPETAAIGFQFHDAGGQSVENLDDDPATGTAGVLAPYENLVFWAGQAVSHWSGRGLSVAAPWFIYDQGEADIAQPAGWWATGFAETYGDTVAAVMSATGQAQPPDLYLMQTGGYMDKAPGSHWVVLDQVEEIRANGGVLVGPGWAHLIDNADGRGVHMSLYGHMQRSLLQAVAIRETEAGNPWTIMPPASAARVGDTITIALPLRPAEVLVSAAGKYAAFGGDPANLGLEVEGGGSITAVSLAGNEITVEVTGTVSHITHAFQSPGIDYRDHVDADGLGYATHRGLIKTSWAETVQIGGLDVVLERFVPTFRIQVSEAGPIYPAQTPAGTLLQIGHSSLNETAPQLQAFWPGGSVITDMGSDSNSTVTVWDGNGPARNGTYDFVVLTEMDLISPDTYWVFPPPGSAEGIERLQHQYWLLQEADDRGAPFAFYLQARLQGQAPTEVQSNAEIARYYCWWLMQHSGRQIPLIDADQIVERMLAAGVPTAEIYRDPSHFEPRARSAFAAAQYMVFAKQLPAGYAATDPIGAEAVMTTLQSDWWAGFGGTERRAMWAGADPLPSPDPRPGAGASSDALSLTSDAYEGPALSGNAPTVSGTVMTFDGNGQWAPDNLPLGPQKYICAAIRFPAVPADASLLFASSDATSLFANPQVAIETSGGLWRAVYYDDPDVMIVVATGTAATTSWTTLEMWTDGATLGISIDGAADVTGTLPGPAPDTDSLRLFWTAAAIEAVQVTARNTVPDAAERASIRAAASARVP